MINISNENMLSEAEYRFKVLNMIRREKFDLILPSALRDNEVQMWIHVIRRGSNDPLSVDLGTTRGYCIFTDKGEKRIERALFGFELAAIADESVYDILGSEEEITEYIKKINPKNIAVNISQMHTHCDSLSYNGYFKLCEMLGEELSKKIISSENVITTYRTRRLKSEIVVVGTQCEIQRRIMEEAYKHIIVGSTSLRDLGLYGHAKLIERGMDVNNVELICPYVIHSDKYKKEIYKSLDYKVQPGDLLVWDWGFERTHMNYGTDFKRYAYIMKNDENDIPKGLKELWEEGIKARSILKRTIKAGKTAKETMEEVVKNIEAAGMKYTPFTDSPKDREMVKAMGKEEKTGFSMDCHCIGNVGNSEVAEGPSMAPYRKDRYDLMIHPNNLFAFEFVVHAYIEEWNERLSFNFEDDAIITERGVEGIYPMNQRIIKIR